MASAKKHRNRNPAETRTKLLQATIDLVSDKGPEAVSLKEAAQKANLSRGVAYLHFKDRDHLLREANSWISNRLQESVKGLKGASLHEHVLDTTKLVLENLEASKLMIVSAMTGKDLDANHPLFKLVKKMLREFIVDGEARGDIDVEIMTYIMLGTISTIVMLGEQKKGADRDTLAGRFAIEWSRVLRRGIFAKGSRAGEQSRLAGDVPTNDAE